MSEPTGELNVTVNFDFLQSLPEDADIAVMEGSTRSSKTVSICQFLILYLNNNPGKVVRCFRADSITHNKTTINDLKLAMRIQGEALGVDSDGSSNYWMKAGKWNKIEKTYTFLNGSSFCFEGTRDPQKLQGCRQDIAWLNEVMEINEDAYAQIAYRTTELTIMDYNPSLSHHWVFNQILTQEKGVYFFRSTYQDNPFLSDKQVREIEKYNPDDPINIKQGTADQFKWDVYGLGKRGRVQGAIFKLWQTTNEWPERMYCQKHGYGLDFGYSNDPTAVVECALFQGNLYLRELLYEQELLITKNISDPSRACIESRLEELGISKDAKIVADCANPSAISDLQTSGFNVHPCTKGPDSIMAGIDLMKGRRIYIHKNSMNLQMEFEQYKFKQKMDGSWINEPIDDFNHLIDGARYWAMDELELARAEVKAAHYGNRQRSFKAKSNLRSNRRR